jgi:hypothetical protein
MLIYGYVQMCSVPFCTKRLKWPAGWQCFVLATFLFPFIVVFETSSPLPSGTRQFILRLGFKVSAVQLSLLHNLLVKEFSNGSVFKSLLRIMQPALEAFTHSRFSCRSVRKFHTSLTVTAPLVSRESLSLYRSRLDCTWKLLRARNFERCVIFSDNTCLLGSA